MKLEVPWQRPPNDGLSHYYTDGPDEIVVFDVLGVRFRVIPTKEAGVHTGRRRFYVACVTCAVERNLAEAVLHSGTTGPTHRIQRHLIETHGAPNELEV